jgi:hypothetical protein
MRCSRSRWIRGRASLETPSMPQHIAGQDRGSETHTQGRHAGRARLRSPCSRGVRRTRRSESCSTTRSRGTAMRFRSATSPSVPAPPPRALRRQGHRERDDDGAWRQPGGRAWGWRRPRGAHHRCGRQHRRCRSRRSGQCHRLARGEWLSAPCKRALVRWVACTPKDSSPPAALVCSGSRSWSLEHGLRCG